MMKCPYCNKEAEFLSSKEFYKKDYGTNLYLCRPCDAYVGTHGDSEKPLGTMANKELRKMRMEVHKAFDSLWKGRWRRFPSRSEAYRWMREQMGLSYEDGHIGMFNVGQCERLVKLVKQFKANNKEVGV